MSATGALTVAADTSGRSHAKAEGGDGGGLAISVIAASATTSITTTAVVGPNANVPGAASVSVTARRGVVTGSTESTLAELVVAGLGLIAVAVGTATATDSGAVSASIASGSTVTSTGGVTVTATSPTTTKAVGRGGTGGGGGGVGVTVTATHSANTSASVGADVGLTAASLTVIASATTNVQIEVLTVTVALAGGAGGTATAQSTGTTEAFVGPAFGATSPANPRQINVSGAVIVRAAVSQTANGNTSAGTGALVGAGGITVSAYLDGVSRAFIGNGAVVHAGTLTVEVVGVAGGTVNPALRTATATSVVGSVALAGGAGSSSTARISGSLDAFIGDGAVVVVGGAGAVTSTGTATATAIARVAGPAGRSTSVPSSPRPPSPRRASMGSARGPGSAGAPASTPPR